MMNKLAILSIGSAAILAIPAAASAQQGTIPVAAQVAQISSVESTRGLDFGELEPNTDATVDHNDAAAGFVEFRTNSNYSIALDLPTALTNVDADDDLGVTFTCGSSTTTAGGDAAAFDCGAGLSDSAVRGMRRVVVWLGGTVNAPETAMAGAYEASATITMTLN